MESVPYRFWIRYLKGLWAHHNHEPFVVLDLACGTGTVSLLLAQDGLLVSGVDISKPMLDVARSKAAEANLYIEFSEQDAVQLNLPGRRFDTVISLYDSLNNIVEPYRLKQCFQRVYDHLEPGGLFIFDVNTAYAFRQGMFDQKSSPHDGPLQYQWTSTYDEATALCTVVMKFDYIRESGRPERFEEVHLQRAYPTNDLIRMLEETGFVSVTAYDAYSLAPIKRRSDRIFFVAKAAL